MPGGGLGGGGGGDGGGDGDGGEGGSGGFAGLEGGRGGGGEQSRPGAVPLRLQLLGPHCTMFVAPPQNVELKTSVLPHVSCSCVAIWPALSASIIPQSGRVLRADTLIAKIPH